VLLEPTSHWRLDVCGLRTCPIANALAIFVQASHRQTKKRRTPSLEYMSKMTEGVTDGESEYGDSDEEIRVR